MTTSLFISSVQKELADERRAVKAFIEGDPLLRLAHGLPEAASCCGIVSGFL